MNRTVLNGAILGSGGADNRSFLSALLHASGIATLSATAFRMASSAVTGRATMAGQLTAIFTAASVVAASCVTSITAYAAGLKYAASSLLASANGTLRANARFVVSSSLSATASLQEAMASVQGTFVSSAVQANAVVSGYVLRNQFVAAVLIAYATTSLNELVGKWTQGSTSAGASLSNGVLSDTSPVSLDRLMILSEESRQMEVPE